MTKKQFLDSAYELSDAEQTKTLYSEWADSYDEEITINGYVSPARTAEALIACHAQTDQPLLDIGCGSGVSGESLQQVGFGHLVGCDFSAPMLALAESKTIYRQLYLSDLNDPFHFVEMPYYTITAIGVMAPGHAGPELITTALELLQVGGLFGFSMNDHTLENPAYLEEIDRLGKGRKVRIRWSEYGDHLPGIDLRSIIMVVERIRS
jgi:predicted TPR repeat methyltransferase